MSYELVDKETIQSMYEYPADNFNWSALAKRLMKERDVFKSIAIDAELKYRKEAKSVVPYIQRELVSTEIINEAIRLLGENGKDK